MSVVFDVRMEMDSEEWQDHCWGSGWTMWPWWYDAHNNGKGLEVSWYEDADNTDTSEVNGKFLTWQELADQAAILARTHEMVHHQLIDSDFDAVGMDCVMQFAFIGEIRYG